MLVHDEVAACGNSTVTVKASPSNTSSEHNCMQISWTQRSACRGGSVVVMSDCESGENIQMYSVYLFVSFLNWPDNNDVPQFPPIQFQQNWSHLDWLHVHTLQNSTSITQVKSLGVHPLHGASAALLPISAPPYHITTQGHSLMPLSPPEWTLLRCTPHGSP